MTSSSTAGTENILQVHGLATSLMTSDLKGRAGSHRVMGCEQAGASGFWCILWIEAQVVSDGCGKKLGTTLGVGVCKCNTCVRHCRDPLYWELQIYVLTGSQSWGTAGVQSLLHVNSSVHKVKAEMEAYLGLIYPSQHSQVMEVAPCWNGSVGVML
jgi:hypothetical protein